MIGVALVGFAGLMAVAPQDTDDDRVWSVQWTYNQNRDQPVAGESYRPTQSNFVVQRRFGEITRAGAGHDYRVLDLPAVQVCRPIVTGMCTSSESAGAQTQISAGTS